MIKYDYTGISIIWQGGTQTVRVIFKKILIFIFVLNGVGQFESAPVWAGLPDHFDYPELTVTPRASDRLQTEADREAGGQWTQFLPVQVSALGTLVAGVASYEASNPGYGTLAIGTGGGWLILTTFLALNYHPYISAWNTLSPMPKNSKRDELTRERAAEEELRSIASMGEKIKWFSVLTNLASSVYMILTKYGSNTSTPNAAQTYSPQGFQIAAAALSLMPLFFRFHWADVYDSQMDYKKRIYAPVASMKFFQDGASGKIVPGLALSFAF